MQPLRPAHVAESQQPFAPAPSHGASLELLSSRTDSQHTLTSLSKFNTLPSCNHHSISAEPQKHDGTPALSASEAAQRYVARHEPMYKPISQRRLDFERARPQWLRECVAEATGVFFFVFPGIASIASFTLNHGHEEGVTAFGSIFQIGWAFGMGVALSIIVCAPVSGGHFNPAVTLAMAFWQGFSWKKVPRYILSQILGAFVAGMLLMAMYWQKIQEFSELYRAAGDALVMGGGPASILAPLPADDQSMGFVFMVEFFADFFIGVGIWTALDPANPFITPGMIPLIIAFAYANMIWGFGGLTLSTNLARDFGTRIVAAIFFGKDVWTYKGYAPIGMLANIPATLLATAFYELWMRESFNIIGKGRALHVEGEVGIYNHMSKTGMLDEEKGMITHPVISESESGKH